MIKVQAFTWGDEIGLSRGPQWLVNLERRTIQSMESDLSEQLTLLLENKERASPSPFRPALVVLAKVMCFM